MIETLLGVFAKQPIPGEVKTRLAADIGAELSARIYEAFLQDMTDNLHGVAHDSVIGFSPAAPAAREYFGELSSGRYALWEQPDESLGVRMSAFFIDHLKVARRVVLIGSDSPSLPRTIVERAFDQLRSHDCVIGPATDGGYYLIGFRRWVDGLFANIEWSGPHVLEQTIHNLTAKGCSLQLVSPWYDVDTLEDLHGLRGHLTALNACGQPEVAPHTWQTLQQMTDLHKGSK